MSFPTFTPTAGDSDNTLLTKIADAQSASAGQRGVDTYNAPGQHVGEWLSIHAIQVSQIAFRRNGVAEILTLAAGDTIRGQFTTVEALTGVIEAYRK